MGGVLLGFALGAMAFTAQGRELGNKVGAAAIDRAKKVMDRAKERWGSSSSWLTSASDCGMYIPTPGRRRGRAHTISGSSS